MSKLSLKNRRNQNIVGTLIQPVGKIMGTAVLQHGYGSTKESTSISIIQESLLNNGFQVFNFDSPNSFGESDGKYEDARLGLHANDFEDVANWTLQQEWFTGKLLVSGHSMGGFASARYALRNSNTVDYAIPFAPVISGEMWLDYIKKFQKDRFEKWNETGWYKRISKTVPSRVFNSPKDVIDEAQSHSLLNENMNNPDMLLVGCEFDTSCPPEHIKIFHDLLTGKKEFKVIKGATHTPRESKHLEELKNTINIWLIKN